MSEAVSGGDSRDAELRVAVERLLRLRHWALKDTRDFIRGVPRRHDYPERVVDKCYNDPLWHCIEELLR